MPQERAVKILAGPIGRQLFGPMMRDRATIFMLHRVTDSVHGISGHTIEFVKNAVEALRNSGAKFVSLRTLVDAWKNGTPTDPDWVVFTIDDGFADQGNLITEAFAPLGCPVTIFLITGFLDGILWPWDDQLAHALANTAVSHANLELGSTPVALHLQDDAARRTTLHQLRTVCKSISVDPYVVVAQVAELLETSVPSKPPAHYKPLTWDAARALERHGVDFGPHSVTHRIFSQLAPDEARKEIVTSWSRLQQELRNPLSVFAWPTGRGVDFSARDMRLAGELGLDAAVSTNAGYALRPPANSPERYGLCRFAFPNDVPTVLRYGSWLERGRQLLPF